MQKVPKCFISWILPYKVSKKTDVLRCTANQAGTEHKLHFEPKHSARAKLAPISNKNGCGRAEVWWRQFRKYFISLILSYKVRENTALIRCTPTKPAQAISSINSPKIQLGPNWQQSTTKMPVARLRCNADSSGSVSYHWYYHIRSGKRQLCSVVPPTKPAQTISSIFSPKI